MWFQSRKAVTMYNEVLEDLSDLTGISPHTWDSVFTVAITIIIIVFGVCAIYSRVVWDNRAAKYPALKTEHEQL